MLISHTVHSVGGKKIWLMRKREVEAKASTEIPAILSHKLISQINVLVANWPKFHPSQYFGILSKSNWPRIVACPKKWSTPPTYDVPRTQEKDLTPCRIFESLGESCVAAYKTSCASDWNAFFLFFFLGQTDPYQGSRFIGRYIFDHASIKSSHQKEKRKGDFCERRLIPRYPRSWMMELRVVWSEKKSSWVALFL